MSLDIEVLATRVSQIPLVLYHRLQSSSTHSLCPRARQRRRTRRRTWTGRPSHRWIRLGSSRCPLRRRTVPLLGLVWAPRPALPRHGPGSLGFLQRLWKLLRRAMMVRQYPRIVRSSSLGWARGRLAKSPVVRLHPSLRGGSLSAL